MIVEKFFRYALFTTVFVGILLSCKNEINNVKDQKNDLASIVDTIIFNIPTGSHTRQVYDLYLPKNRDSLTPVIITIHGGAWKSGQKEDLNSLINLIQKKWNDVAIVNMNYRLASNSDKIHHNEIIADIDNVVNNIISNKKKYNISSKIAVLGVSAGGQLAMIYAYKYNRNIKCVASIFGPSILSDWSWYNSYNIWLGAKIGDILTEYIGVPFDTLVYNSVSPYWNVNSSSPPTIIFHGSLDPIVPVYQSQWFYEKLKKLGVRSEYYEYLAFHSFDDSQLNDVINKLVSFFKLSLI